MGRNPKDAQPGLAAFVSVVVIVRSIPVPMTRTGAPPEGTALLSRTRTAMCPEFAS